MLPYGYSVKLYKDNNFQGGSTVIDALMFEDDTFEMTCMTIPGDFNDRTSSLEVYRNTKLGNSLGYWTSITGTSDIDYEITTGFYSTHSESETK